MQETLRLIDSANTLKNNGYYPIARVYEQRATQQESGMILVVCIDGPYRGLIGVKGILPWRLPLESDDPCVMTDSQFLREIPTLPADLLALVLRVCYISILVLVVLHAALFVDILYITTISGFEGTS